MGQRLKSVKTNLTGLREVMEDKNAIINFVMYRSTGMYVSPDTLRGTWKIQIHAKIDYVLLGMESVYIVETKFVNELDYFSALWLALDQWDAEFEDDFGVSDLDSFADVFIKEVVAYGVRS